MSKKGDTDERLNRLIRHRALLRRAMLEIQYEVKNKQRPGWKRIVNEHIDQVLRETEL